MPITDHPFLTTTLLTSMLSAAIAPVTLISGIAFLLSIMATRYGRCIDRIRTLLKEIKTSSESKEEREIIQAQIKILYTRTRALRTTMTIAACSLFCIALTVCGSFSSMMFQFPNALTVACFFTMALLLLVAAIFGYIRDILISLRAVKIEIRTLIKK